MSRIFTVILKTYDEMNLATIILIYFQVLVSIVAAVYNHVKFSIKRKETFKDMVVLLDVDIVKFHRNFDIGWLSLGECLRVLLRNYEPLMVMLSLEADSGDPTATGLFQQLTSYRYLALLHFMADVLGGTNHLSRLFQ